MSESVPDLETISKDHTVKDLREFLRARGKPVGGNKDVLVKRVVKPEAGTITEYTVHGNVARTSTFKRRASSWVFDVSDAKKSFYGQEFHRNT